MKNLFPIEHNSKETNEHKKSQLKLKKSSIKYNPIEEQLESPGPGSFELRQPLLKTTFNVTYT